MNNTPLQPQGPARPLILCAAIASALAVALLAVTAQAWFGYEERAESADKARGYRDAGLTELRQAQVERLTSYRVTDVKNNRVAVPIERAMHLVVVAGGNITFRPADPAEAVPAGLSADAVAAGRKVYQTLGCMACHPMDGTGRINGAPAPGPSLKDLYGSTVPLEGGQSVLAGEAYIRESIRKPQAKIVKGYTAVQMPDFGPVIKDPDIDNVIQFLKASSRHYKPGGDK